MRLFRSPVAGAAAALSPSTLALGQRHPANVSNLVPLRPDRGPLELNAPLARASFAGIRSTSVPLIVAVMGARPHPCTRSLPVCRAMTETQRRSRFEVMAEPAAAEAPAPTTASVPTPAATTAVPEFVSATPILASLDIEKTVAFYCSRLGFTSVFVDPGSYGIVSRGPVRLHFWPRNREIAESCGCRIQVTHIDSLYATCQGHKIVHANGKLKAQPWGTREFTILDEDGSCVTFYEDAV